MQLKKLYGTFASHLFDENCQVNVKATFGSIFSCECFLIELQFSSIEIKSLPPRKKAFHTLLPYVALNFKATESMVLMIDLYPKLLLQ